MQIRVPQLAEGIHSGTVVSILVSEGDKVKKDQTLLELETEKAVAPIPSSADGVIETIHVKEGDKVNVGHVIVTLAGKGGSKKSKAGEPSPGSGKDQPSKQGEVPASSPQTQVPFGVLPGTPVNLTIQPYQYQSESGAPPPAAPSIRKLAAELGIDLTRIKGSERGGRIAIRDMRAYLLQIQQMAFQGQAAKTEVAVPQQYDFSKWGPVRKKEMTTLRKKISERMLESWTTIPHVTQFDEADLSRILSLRKQHLAEYEKKGARLTVTAFLLKAVVKMLKQYPVFNASIDDLTEEVVYKDYYHIGLAVDTDQGLIVPVIRDANKKSLFELSLEISGLAERTRQRKISLEEMQGGTFTISNQGGIGSGHFTPIINKPEAAILGVGQGKQKIPLTLSYDHRLIDGGKAARFMVDLVKTIENFPPSEMKITKLKVPRKAGKKGKKKK